jgi:hypothetical protein
VRAHGDGVLGDTDVGGLVGGGGVAAAAGAAAVVVTATAGGEAGGDRGRGEHGDGDPDESSG